MERVSLNEFLSKAFKIRCKEIRKSVLKEQHNDEYNHYENILEQDWIELNKERFLSEVEEFKYTKKINVIKLPMYICKKSDVNLEPIEIVDNNTCNVKTIASLDYKISKGVPSYFSEIVNLYTLSRVKINPIEDVIYEASREIGLHVIPETFDKDFRRVREIRFRWNPDALEEGLLNEFTKEDWEESILSEIKKEAMDNYNVTIKPEEYFVLRGTNLLSNKSVELIETK